MHVELASGAEISFVDEHRCAYVDGARPFDEFTDGADGAPCGDPVVDDKHAVTRCEVPRTGDEGLSGAPPCNTRLDATVGSRVVPPILAHDHQTGAQLGCDECTQDWAAGFGSADDCDRLVGERCRQGRPEQAEQVGPAQHPSNVGMTINEGKAVAQERGDGSAPDRGASVDLLEVNAHLEPLDLEAAARGPYQPHFDVAASLFNSQDACMNPPVHRPTDFDPLIGSWSVNHRRLRQRLANNDDWDTFSGTSSTRPILSGWGVLEDNWIDLPDGAYSAVAIRTFDPASKQWAIWWFDARTPHQLDPPVVGTFTNGIGTFDAEATMNGHPIAVRFNWFGITTDSPRWEQAFSSDGGTTWETNWTMDFTRTE